MTASAPYRSSDPLPRYLWDDSLLDFPWNDFLELRDRIGPVKFLVQHTRPPRFLCRIVENRKLSGLPEEDGIRVWRDEEQNQTVWKTNFRFYATYFAFFDPTPDDKTMGNILRDACVDRQLRDVFFGTIK